MNIINSNLQFRSLDYSNKPDTIVLHNADASICSIQDIHAWHLANGWAGCGYHYLVRKDGSIYTGRPENAVGAHCPGQNSHSIGICAEGKYMVEQMPEAQKQAIKELGIHIKKKYGIKTAGGHKEFYSTDCPGTNYPLAEIKSAILNGNAAVVNNVVASAPVQKSSVSTGDSTVKIIQQQLNAVTNAGLTVDGLMGQHTIDKIKELQTVAGIDVDGKWGAQSAGVIGEIYSKPVIRTGSRGVAVRVLQFRLGIQFDGIFGNQTAGKLLEYQKNNGLTADAICGSQTWSKLLGL